MKQWLQHGKASYARKLPASMNYHSLQAPSYPYCNNPLPSMELRNVRWSKTRGYKTSNFRGNNREINLTTAAPSTTRSSAGGWAREWSVYFQKKRVLRSLFRLVWRVRIFFSDIMQGRRPNSTLTVTPTPCHPSVASLRILDNAKTNVWTTSKSNNFWVPSLVMFVCHEGDKATVLLRDHTRPVIRPNLPTFSSHFLGHTKAQLIASKQASVCLGTNTNISLASTNTSINWATGQNSIYS